LLLYILSAHNSDKFFKTFNQTLHSTRKLSHRKYDRVMRPIYGCPVKFRKSLSLPEFVHVPNVKERPTKSEAQSLRLEVKEAGKVGHKKVSD